mmetsp:Transcript_30948/g.66904  ORF Transcript_30948/g.66904 Transcript_30948/m.66904 type:complete len:1123 (-) Transcript_30948:118-3486(-)
MITLRGKLTRTLVERKPLTPPTLRSNVATATAIPPPGIPPPFPPGPGNTPNAVAAAAAAPPDAFGVTVAPPPSTDTAGAPATAIEPAGTVPPGGNAPANTAGIETAPSSSVTSPAAPTTPSEITPASVAGGTTKNGTPIETTAKEVESSDLVEEWTWRGVWAFGELPEEEEKKKSDSNNHIAGKNEEKEKFKGDGKGAGENTERVIATGGDGSEAMTKDATSNRPPTGTAISAIPDAGTNETAMNATNVKNATNTTTPKTASPPKPKKRPGRPPKESKVKPRPFTYRWLKAKDAGGVIVPSSLVIMAAAAEDEEKKNLASWGEKIGTVKGPSEGSAAITIEGDKDKKPEEQMKERGGIVRPGGTTGVMCEAPETNNQSQTMGENAKRNSGDEVMKDVEEGSKTGVPTDCDSKPASTSNTPSSETPNENPTKPSPSKDATTTLKPPTTYGEPPYADAGRTHPPGTCPKSGKWEGHFENVVPNATSSKKKRRDKRDNRIREMFYLFFNATPPPDAREAFVDSDSTIAANQLLEDRSSTSVADKEDGAADGGAEVERKLHLLKKGYIHVRGYGTNRFGTFEIVGSLDPKTGNLQCQRMYVPVPTAAEISKATGQRRSSSGRFLSGLDLTIPEDDEDGKKRGSNRKRKSTWKKRDMDSSGFEEIGVDGIPVNGPGARGIDIASIVKKRSRLSNENGMSKQTTPGSGGAAKLPPQCRGAAEGPIGTHAPPAGSAMSAVGTKPTPSPRAPPAKATSAGSGKKGGKKKKAKGGGNAQAPALQSYKAPNSGIKGPMPGSAPPVTVIPTLPTAGDPYLARWRAAHYLYYQRVEQEPEGESAANPKDDATTGSNPNNTLVKINYVIYEGEMHDGVRDGRGICLFNNGTLYEGQWKRNKEHGTGTLMSADRKRIIYTGAWEKGKMHGHGEYRYYTEKSKSTPKDNGRYVGGFRQNLRNGHGVYSLPDGCIYDGEWRDNIQNGWGVFRWRDGSVYEGQWKDGRRHGASGILVVSDGFRYEGAWVNNAMEGRGVATYPKGQVYDGTWVGGKREGRGTIRFTNGAVYEGRFKEDYMEGQGTMKMNRNVIIPKLSGEEDGKQDASRDNEAHDWMIPLQFQSDISHIHQKAGFTQIGL